MNAEEIQKILDLQRQTSEIYTKTERQINITIANKLTSQDITWRNNVKQAMAKLAQTPERQAFMKKLLEDRKNNPEYYKKLNEGIKEREKDLNYKQQQLEGIRKKYQDPEYREKMKNSQIDRVLKNKGYLVCPAGIFTSLKNAARAMNIGHLTVFQRIRKQPKDYYYISIEEYAVLSQEKN